MKKILSGVSVIILFFLACNAVAQNSGKIKYVFLFIGDGMGLNQVFVTEKYNELTGIEPLIFMNHNWAFGLSRTECADSNKITDSGAGGTAIACGKRVPFGGIGDFKGTPVESIAEYLHSKNNFKIGIITSVPLNHATPACFYGHESTRKNYDNLTKELISSGFEFFAGGGFDVGNADSTKIIYKNFNMVLDDLRANDFHLVLNETQMNSMRPKESSRILIVDTAIRNKQLLLKNVYPDERNSLPCILDVPEQKMTLAKYTGLAETALMNDQGFFIMVEGGKIDWACHDNDALTAIFEINAFNEAIRKAYEFYLKYPQNTLIIVTADHETGGMAQGTYMSGKSSKKNGGYELYIKKLLQQKNSYIYSAKDSLAKTQRDARIGWTTFEHTSAPVGIWAIGNGSEVFSGIMKNEEIKEKILELIK